MGAPWGSGPGPAGWPDPPKPRPSMGGVAWLVGIIGLLLIAGAGLWLTAASDKSATAQGEVIRVVSSTDEDGSTTFASVVAFQAGDDRIEFQDSVYTNVGPKQVGDLVMVAYNPETPTSATITSGLRVALRWFGIAALAFTGLVLVCVAIAYR